MAVVQAMEDENSVRAVVVSWLTTKTKPKLPPRERLRISVRVGPTAHSLYCASFTLSMAQAMLHFAPIATFRS